MIEALQLINEQSGPKPNLVAKILATQFGSFLWGNALFKKHVQYESNNIM